MVNVGKYTSPMDPMGQNAFVLINPILLDSIYNLQHLYQLKTLSLLLTCPLVVQHMAAIHSVHLVAECCLAGASKMT